MKAIIFSTREAFEAREAELHAQCLAHLPGYCATRWAEPKIHPKTGACALAWGPQIDRFLHAGEVVVDLTPDWHEVRLIVPGRVGQSFWRRLWSAVRRFFGRKH